MVNVKKSENTEISASGILVAVDSNGIKVEDEKTGVQTLSFDDLQEFLGKEIKIKISNKECLDID